MNYGVPLFKKKTRKMNPLFTDIIKGTAGQIIGGGMGMILEGINDRRQREQQQALQDMQIRGQKEMTDYNMSKQLQMWKDTSYGAQREQMELAGINPALMYGMGGGGGQTTGSANGSVSGGAAPSGGGEVQAMMGMGLQAALQQAQIKVLETQAKKNEAEATKTAGVDTTETTTRIQALEQGIDNERQKFEIGKLEITLKNIENFEKQATQENRLDYISYETNKAMKQLEIVRNEAYISSATIQQKVKIIQEEAIGAVLKNTLTSSQTDKTKSDILVNNAELKKIANGIMLDWDKLSIDQRETRIKEQLAQWMTDPNREAIQQALGVINSIMHESGRR